MTPVKGLKTERSLGIEGLLLYPISERDLVSKNKVECNREKHLLSAPGLCTCHVSTYTCTYAHTHTHTAEGGQKERQTDRQTDRQTHTHTERT